MHGQALRAQSTLQCHYGNRKAMHLATPTAEPTLSIVRVLSSVPPAYFKHLSRARTITPVPAARDHIQRILPLVHGFMKSWLPRKSTRLTSVCRRRSAQRHVRVSSSSRSGLSWFVTPYRSQAGRLPAGNRQQILGYCSETFSRRPWPANSSWA